MSYYKLKGLDNGYMFTKDNECRIFKSACTTFDDQVYEGREITIDGTKYYFGTGRMCSDEDKITSEMNLVCTLGNLALTGENTYILCANLPISQWKDKRDKFKETLLDYNNHEVVYKDKKFSYKISDISVFPQGVCAVYAVDKQSNTEKILFDIGSKTINIALFELVHGDNGKEELRVTKYLTLFKGILNLYEKIINQVNRRYDLSLDKERARFIVQQGLMVDGKQVDVSFAKDIIREYLLDILVDLKKEFPYKTTQIYLVGGGAELLYPIFQSNFRSCIKVPDSQFANAKGLYEKGKEVYAKYI